MTDEKTDHTLWKEAKKQWDAMIWAKPLDTLPALPRMCSWPSGLPRIFDQFRRRFEYSRERAYLRNQFLTWSEKDPSKAIDEADAYSHSLCELLWLVYAALNNKHSHEVAHAKVALCLDVGETHACESDCKHTRIAVRILSAAFLRRGLILDGTDAVAFRNTYEDSEFLNWTDFQREQLDFEYKVEDDGFPQHSSSPKKLLPLDAYRVFFEDDRAQMVFSIDPTSDKVCINGRSQSACKPNVNCNSGCPGKADEMPYCLASVMPQIDPLGDRGDPYARFMNDAFLPILEKRRAKAFEARAEKKNAHILHVGAYVATPSGRVAAMHQGNKTEGSFGFINLELGGDASPFEERLGEDLTGMIFRHVGHLHEPLLRHIAESRELKVLRQREQLRRSEKMLELIQAPLRVLMNDLMGAQAVTQAVNSTLFAPHVALFSVASLVQKFFLPKQIVSFGNVRWESSHNPDHRAQDDLLNAVCAVTLTALGISGEGISDSDVLRARVLAELEKSSASRTPDSEIRELLRDIVIEAVRAKNLSELRLAFGSLKNIVFTPFKPDASNWPLLALMVVFAGSGADKVKYDCGRELPRSKLVSAYANNSSMDFLFPLKEQRKKLPLSLPVASFHHLLDFVSDLCDLFKDNLEHIHIGKEEEKARVRTGGPFIAFHLADLNHSSKGLVSEGFKRVLGKMKQVISKKLGAGLSGDFEKPFLSLAERCAHIVRIPDVKSDSIILTPKEGGVSLVIIRNASKRELVIALKHLK